MRISKGSAAREAQRDVVVYHWTQRQLEDHDRLLIQNSKERIKADMMKKAAELNKQLNASIHKEWDNRERLFCDKGYNNNVIEILALLIAVSVRTLVEDFGWKPLPKEGDYRKSRKLARFADAVVSRVEAITDNELMDIREYNDETYDMYGVRFVAEEERQEQ